jgi:hypothetical protein
VQWGFELGTLDPCAGYVLMHFSVFHPLARPGKDCIGLDAYTKPCGFEKLRLYRLFNCCLIVTGLQGPSGAPSRISAAMDGVEIDGLSTGCALTAAPTPCMVASHSVVVAWVSPLIVA